MGHSQSSPASNTHSQQEAEPELTDLEMGQQALYRQLVPKKDIPGHGHALVSCSAVPFVVFMGISSETTYLVPVRNMAVGAVAALPQLHTLCPKAEGRGGSRAALSTCLSPSPSIPHSRGFHEGLCDPKLCSVVSPRQRHPQGTKAHLQLQCHCFNSCC